MFSFRLAGALAEQVEALGGNQYCKRLVTDAVMASAGDDGTAEERTGRVAASPVLSECPRWMHHRKGVYCKTCGQTP